MLATLSVHSVVDTVGAYAGLASLIGLALLALLYFSQARELRRLTEWIEQDEERRRLGQGPLPRSIVIPPGGATAPAASATVTTAVPGARRVAVPAPTGAAGAQAAGTAPASTLAP